MAIKALKKTAQLDALATEKNVEIFISKGGALATHEINLDEDHRLTLRIPQSLMAKIDIKRKQRLGKISRNLWILEVIDKATRK